MEFRVNGKAYQSIFDPELWPKPVIGTRDDANGGRCVLGQLDYAAWHGWITSDDVHTYTERLGKFIRDTVSPIHDPLNGFHADDWNDQFSSVCIMAAVNNQLPEFQKQSKWVEIDLATRQV